MSANIFEDISKLSTNAASVFLENGKNIQDKLAAMIKPLIENMDFVTREEFDILKESLHNLQKENAELQAKIKELEDK